MNHLGKDIVFVVLQNFLENNLHESAQKLEQESKVYFNMTRFTSMILHGKWNDIDDYLRSFTSPNDNTNSMMMFWLIEKQKFLEALDEHNIVKAAAIFGKDVKPWWEKEPDKHLEFAKLLTMKNFRDNEKYAHFDVQNTREQLVLTLKSELKYNRALLHKLDFPTIERQRLPKLIAQGREWEKQGLHPKSKELPTNYLSADHRRGMSSSSTPNQQWMEGVPVTNARDNGAGPSSSPLVSNARDNGAGPSSSPLVTVDWLSLFPK